MKISNKKLKQIIKEELDRIVTNEELDSRLGLDTGIGQGSFTKAKPLERVINARREIELALKSEELQSDAFSKTETGKESFEVTALLRKALQLLEEASKTEYFKGF